MRLLFLTALLIGVLPSLSSAQTYYNAPNGGGSNTLYNLPSGGNAPINLKAMVQGNMSKATSRTGYTYQGKPYGIDRSSYSLALSPEQARQNNINNRRVAEARERETEQLRARRLAAHNKNRVEDTEMETQKYLSKFQSPSNLAVNTTQRKKVLYYNQNKNDPVVPKRVFNTPY